MKEMRKMALVGITDPGHGGFDPGAMGNGLREGDLTWEFGLKFARNMERSGVKMYFTREKNSTATNNRNAELAYRSNYANEKGASFYISFHINAGGGTGFESYRYPKTDSSTIRLHQLVHGNVAAVFSQSGMANRGIKTADFAVLRGTNMPAVLLELGFIDNTRDAKIIRTEEFQNKVAEAVARGVCQWLGISYVEEPAEPPQVEGTPIMGEAAATLQQLLGFTRSINEDFPSELPPIYLEIGKRYGIRGDIAFAQMLKETGYFRFGGDVRKEQNNFAGIGAIGDGSSRASFKTMEEGVIAHIQHLYAYCTTKPVLAGETVVDPRFHLVNRGSAPTWEALNGKWAVPGTNYGQEIVSIHQKVMEFKVEPGKDYMGHWAEKEITRVIQEGLMYGDDDGYFYPDRMLTRAELAAILCRLLDR